MICPQLMLNWYRQSFIGEISSKQPVCIRQPTLCWIVLLTSRFLPKECMENYRKVRNEMTDVEGETIKLKARCATPLDDIATVRWHTNKPMQSIILVIVSLSIKSTGHYIRPNAPAQLTSDGCSHRNLTQPCQYSCIKEHFTDTTNVRLNLLVQNAIESQNVPA